MSYYQLAKTFEGTKEIRGPKHNKVVLAFYADVGHSWVDNDEVAWCAAFVGAMLERSGMRSTRSLAARSYLQWGNKVAVDDAKPGDIVVFKRGNSSWEGHVAFFVRQTKASIYVLGGNQSNAVNVKAYPKSKLLGIRRAEGGLIPDMSVRDVQQRLIDLGYYEVGKVDGMIGPRTKGAILAFRNDNDLPLIDRIDGILKDKLKTAKPRPVGIARAEGKPEGSSILNGANAQIATAGAGAAASVATAVTESVEKTEQGVGLLDRFTSLTGLGDFIQPYLPIIGAVVFIAILIIAWKIRSARIDDFRTGKTP